MAKEEMLEFEGVVAEVLPDARCRVTLDNGHEVIAYTSGRMKKNRIRILAGDRVTIEMTPYERGAYFDRILALRVAYQARSAEDSTTVMSVTATMEYAEGLVAIAARTSTEEATSPSSEQDYANGTGY